MSDPLDPVQQRSNSPEQQSNNNTSSGKVTLTDTEVAGLSSAEFLANWRKQEGYISSLEQRLAHQEGELLEYRQIAERAKVQLGESQQREKALIRRLAAKEQEAHDYVCQVTELKSVQVPTNSTLRSTLLDPSVNTLLQLLRNELQATKSRLEDTQNELAAWKFTPDSNTGKRLMAKCRLLYQENEELGKITSSGRVAKLESDFALQKSFSEEVRKSQLELDSFLADLDEDVEGMQSTILYLQGELKRAHDATQSLQRENAGLRQNGGRANGESVNCDQERTDSDSDGHRTRVKRVRRSSVLSIDYEEDTLINANGDVAMSDAE
ncbi:pre-mRNA-splicing regulator female-lethal(2)D [Onthophagus taurus]|uniref:pre-mRNA-splicing regulator female-lethal(2)D n=1 Tax=Onthophagus taurus TaxID=166361 RepID=UPI000C207141|nr:pre-mRNA-splicing regulator female-lethal(2)D [Onthophagus taurus]